MEQVLPSNRCWAASFFSASKLVPGPQLEQVPSKFSLHTSQLIPQAPVGIRKTPFSGVRCQVSGFRFQVSGEPGRTLWLKTETQDFIKIQLQVVI
jgi:hypothetical protein